MATEKTIGRTPEEEEASAARLWHLRRGFDVAVFIAFIVLVFGLFFHAGSYDLSLDSFLGRQLTSGGLSSVNAAASQAVLGAPGTAWLWWLIARGLTVMGGPLLVLIVTTLLSTAAFAIFALLFSRRVSIVVTAFLLLAAAYLARPYVVPGGQAAGVFLFAALAALLINSVKSGGRRFWFAPAIMALWVNIDYSWASGAALVLAFVVIMALAGRPRRTAKIAALAAALVVTLLNPDLTGAYQALWRLPVPADSSAAFVAPMAAAATAGKIALYVLAGAALAMGLYAGGIAAMAFLLTSILIFIVGVSASLFPMAALAVMAAFITGLPAVIEKLIGLAKGAPAAFLAQWVRPLVIRARIDVTEADLPENMDGAEVEGGQEDMDDAEEPVPAGPDRYGRMRRRYALQAALSALGLLAILAMFSLTVAASKHYTLGAGMRPSARAARAIAAILDRRLSGIVLADPRWTGALLQETYPATRVVVDSRPLLSDKATYDTVAWTFGKDVHLSAEEAHNRYNGMNISVLLVPADWPRAIEMRQWWAPVYWDDNAAVFLANIPENSDLIRRSEAVLTYPQYFDFRPVRGRLSEILPAVERKAAADPDSAYAQYELGKGNYFLGKYDAAADHLITAVGIDPGLARVYNTLGDLVTTSRSETVSARIAEALSVAFGQEDPALVEALRDAASKEPDTRHRSLAMILYGLAIRNDPEYAIAYLRLGNLQIETNQVMAGIRTLMRAQELDDRRPQLENIRPGLRSELDARVKQYTMPRTSAPAPGAGSTAGRLGSAPSAGSAASTASGASGASGAR